MSVPPVHSRVLFGMTAHPIAIECHVGSGLPSTTIVGLPEASVRESRDRVQSAFKNCGFDYPDGRVVINLAPGHLAKSTSSLDLPIAISLLATTQQIRTTTLNQYEFLGELGLYGSLGSVIGVLSCALAASQDNRCLVIPTANTIEAGLAPPQTIAVAATLNEVARLLNGQVCVTPPSCPEPEQIHPTATTFDKVLGQHSAKRALTIAAAGGHHILMVGPPGTGKT
ncbi:MAG: ATP-binding protein, partial [Gammaproteobacteria bacterium]|nr:ATP-binding protein [Gammaproteobacteria bacterium]